MARSFFFAWATVPAGAVQGGSGRRTRMACGTAVLPWYSATSLARLVVVGDVDERRAGGRVASAYLA